MHILKNTYFRRLPVPYTGINRFLCFRSIHTSQEKRMACDIEAKPYVRAAKNYTNLLSTWDDIDRMYYKSWKEQGKIKKQSMKHVRK